MFGVCVIALRQVPALHCQVSLVTCPVSWWCHYAHCTPTAPASGNWDESACWYPDWCAGSCVGRSRTGLRSRSPMRHDDGFHKILRSLTETVYGLVMFKLLCGSLLLWLSDRCVMVMEQTAKKWHGTNLYAPVDRKTGSVSSDTTIWRQFPVRFFYHPQCTASFQSTLGDSAAACKWLVQHRIDQPFQRMRDQSECLNTIKC